MIFILINHSILQLSYSYHKKHNGIKVQNAHFYPYI